MIESIPLFTLSRLIGLVFSVPTVRYKIEKHFKLDAKKGTRERIDEESIKKRKVNEQA